MLLNRILHFFVILISLTAVRCFSKQLFVTPQVDHREEKKENKRSGRQAYKVSYSLKLLKLGPVCTTTKYTVWCWQKTSNIIFVVTSFFCFCNLVHTGGIWKISCNQICLVMFMKNKMTRQKIHWCTCQRTKAFVTWQKVVGFQTFLTASLKFGDSYSVKERILVGENKLLALEMASCWQFFCKTNKIVHSVKRALSKAALILSSSSLLGALYKTFTLTAIISMVSLPYWE